MNEKADSEELNDETMDSNEKENLLDESEIHIIENEIDDNEENPTQMKETKRSSLLRTGLYALTVIVLVFIIWGVISLVENEQVGTSQVIPTATIEPTSLPSSVKTPTFTTVGKRDGVLRQLEVEAPYGSQSQDDNRTEILTYEVVAGDSIFGIAEKFGLKPETVLWSNRYTLGDTPDGIGVGIELVILPEDGVYHRWSEGEGLNGVAEFYGVDPDVIVNYPLNGLSPETVGNYSNPNIEPGTMLVVPGGTRPTVAWIVARDNPASGNTYLGPGACSGILYGAVGTGSFTWPTSVTWLSGYDWNPPVHNGLDFGGDFGSPIYASDSGVVVYSGWSNVGYGNLMVVDHDSGWQTFYAHLLDGSMLPCGTSVNKGQLIASMGSTGNSTGPHLHFEIRYNGYPVNPWDMLN